MPVVGCGHAHSRRLLEISLQDSEYRIAWHPLTIAPIGSLSDIYPGSHEGKRFHWVVVSVRKPTGGPPARKSAPHRTLRSARCPSEDAVASGEALIDALHVDTYDHDAPEVGAKARLCTRISRSYSPTPPPTQGFYLLYLLGGLDSELQRRPCILNSWAWQTRN